MAFPVGIEWLVFLSGIGFTVALAPQLWRTIHLGRADDLSIPFIGIVVIASILAMTYFMLLDITGWFVYFGYAANILVWSIVMWYRLFPRPGSMGHEGQPPSNGS